MAVFAEEDEGDPRGPRAAPAAVSGGPRPIRPFKSSEEYLYAMKEDLAEWLQGLYGLNIKAEDFMEHLETGVVLCRHANRTISAARTSDHPLGATRDVIFRGDVQPGTFHARDNVSNFISWCRGELRLHECLLFETDDLVMRKNERNVVLCLLEVARRGSTLLGMPAPLLVQLEREIDAEIAADCAAPPSSLSLDSDGHEADDDSDTQSEATPPVPRQIVTNDLRSLHERVAELLNRCSCPSQFPMLRVGDGKYRIGETQLLIFVRVLRNHVMVRVGGGWDTLEHYLDKHDPCRCRTGRRFSMTRISPSPSSGSGSLQVHIIKNHRPQSSGTPSSSSRSSSVPTSPPSRRRSFDWSRLSSPDEPWSGGRTPSRGSSSDDWGAPCPRRHPGGRGKARPCSADSSSEGEACQRKQAQGRRGSPRKVPKVGDDAPSNLQTMGRTNSISRIPTSQSPSPRHRPNSLSGGGMSSSRSETSLFSSPTYRGRPSSGMTSRRPGRTPCRTASASPARTPSSECGGGRRTFSLQSSPVKPVPPLLEEILHDSEFLDSDEKILERMERLINAYRARETSPDMSEDVSMASSPGNAKSSRRSSLSKIPVFTWHVRQ